MDCRERNACATATQKLRPLPREAAAARSSGSNGDQSKVRDKLRIGLARGRECPEKAQLAAQGSDALDAQAADKL